MANSVYFSRDGHLFAFGGHNHKHVGILQYEYQKIKTSDKLAFLTSSIADNFEYLLYRSESTVFLTSLHDPLHFQECLQEGHD